MKIVYLKNFRRGLATNSSSTHSLIYRNDGELFKDLDIFECNYYGRFTSTIAASRDAKIKYVLASIMYEEPLVKIMSSFYPEMKQYYPKIKDAMKKDEDGYYMNYEAFGMYFRRSLSFSNNLAASVDYLRNVIDDPEIIIVGGSDETDFVYDTIADHVRVPDPDMVSYGSKFSKFGISKNGNYWVGYGYTGDYVASGGSYDGEYQIKNSFCGKIRFATEIGKELVPEFPELIDLKITNKCEHGCKFCFMDSNMKGKHADLSFLLKVVGECGNANNGEHRVEFSIGGGNILLYPNLETLLKKIHSNGHIANVTIRVEDCEKIINDNNLKTIFEKYVDGVGVSIENVEDAKVLAKFDQEFNKDKCTYDSGYIYIVAHMIPEYIGVEMTNAITDYFKKSNLYINKLFLGYKENGRGSTQKHTEFTKEDLESLFDEYRYISIDTTFANRYFWWIKDNFSFKNTITTMEGEYSMYIDGVTQNAYKSSYQTDKPYNMHVNYNKREDIPFYNIKESFANIRRDNGLKSFDEVEHHYYDDSKHYWEENYENKK